jgi:sugar (pentulose or hexulose) kinase
MSEASLLGAGVAAAAGAELYPSLAEASRGMVHIAGEYQPDAERHRQYQFFVDKYRETYQQLKHVLRDVTRHVSGA